MTTGLECAIKDGCELKRNNAKLRKLGHMLRMFCWFCTFRYLHYSTIWIHFIVLFMNIPKHWCTYIYWCQDYEISNPNVMIRISVIRYRVDIRYLNILSCMWIRWQVDQRIYGVFVLVYTISCINQNQHRVCEQPSQI